jgi:hypothetical protein
MQYLNTAQSYATAVTNCANAGGGLVSWNSFTEQVSLQASGIRAALQQFGCRTAA